MRSFRLRTDGAVTGRPRRGGGDDNRQLTRTVPASSLRAVTHRFVELSLRFPSLGTSLDREATENQPTLGLELCDCSDIAVFDAGGDQCEQVEIAPEPLERCGKPQHDRVVAGIGAQASRKQLDRALVLGRILTLIRL